MAMHTLRSIEVKAFVPARDFEVSQRFYQDLGFEVAWSDDELAYLRHDRSAFLLQRFYQKEHAGNFMMHLLVEDVDAWWRHVQTSGLLAKYGVHAEPPSDKPWGMRDFVIVDPTGVLWRIAENTK
jgi:catechol 2,3-dioxygenase-like lactoylglutathione lyase family enzyme